MKKRMSFILGFLIVLTTILSGCGPDKNAELNKKLDAVITNCPSGFNGSVLVAVDGKVVLKKGYGMADAKNKVLNQTDTTFTIYSMTKQFTAMAIMMLEERGLLSVNDPVTKYIPDFKDGTKITIHQLLSMTSGFANDTSDKYNCNRVFSVEELVSKIKALPLNSEPGTKFEYSNPNYIILGYIIEKASGQKYGEFLEQNIFDPLGMTDTRYDFSNENRKNMAKGYKNISKEVSIPAVPVNMSYVYSGGGIYSTVGDLFKWNNALYTEKLVKKSTIEKMFKPNLDNYGYGWYVIPKYQNALFHSGYFWGYRSLIVRFLDSKTAVIILTNEEDDDAFDKVSDGIIQALEDEKIIIKNNN